MAAALRLQGGALLGAADAFGELTSTPAPAVQLPSPAGTPTGAVVASGGAAGFGAATASGVPPAVALSGGPGSLSGASDGGGNPYHSQGAAPPGTMPGADTRSYSSAGSQGAPKRFSEPEAAAAEVKGGDGAPAARYPVAPAEQPPSDNPYSSVRSYQYA